MPKTFNKHLQNVTLTAAASIAVIVAFDAYHYFIASPSEWTNKEIYKDINYDGTDEKIKSTHSLIFGNKNESISYKFPNGKFYTADEVKKVFSDYDALKNVNVDGLLSKDSIYTSSIDKLLD